MNFRIKNDRGRREKGSRENERKKNLLPGGDVMTVVESQKTTTIINKASCYKKLKWGKGVVVSTPNIYYYFQHLKRFTGLNEIC